MDEKICLANQTNLTIEDANKILQITKTNTVIELSQRTLTITGSNIEVVKLDPESKTVCLCGNFATFKFSKTTLKQSFLKRIFK